MTTLVTAYLFEPEEPMTTDFDDCPPAWRDFTLEAVIAHMEATREDEWNVDTVRSVDGRRNCFFGHLFSMGADEKESNLLWNWFEETWSTTYAIYPVNDGTYPGYDQPTPKQRVLAYLRALQDGTELTTHQSMDLCYEESVAAELAAAAAAA